MLSPDGRSRMWDAKANGYARGEGFVSILVKTLSKALEDNDDIECIIRETGVNQDGYSAGLTVPNARAQAELIKSTYAKCGLDCHMSRGRPQYFEAHGTGMLVDESYMLRLVLIYSTYPGTRVGDPKEAQAIHQAFFSEIPESKVCDDGHIYVGSIKTIIGHLEGAAGLAGLLKASLAVQHGLIPPNLLFDELNPEILPFYGNLEVPTKLKPWPQLPYGQPRRASVNSFGFGGTNAQSVLMFSFTHLFFLS